MSGNKVRMHESNGGGVVNDAGAAGSLTLTNCTLVANRSGTRGGGFANLTGSTALTNCTVSGNTASFAGGIIGYGGSATTVLNTIVAANHGHNCVSGSSVVASQGHNLDDDGSCFTTGGSDLVDTDALLPTLANYGGPTATLPPCTAFRVPSVSCRGRSPAIDAGDDAVLGQPDNLATDQRGLPRPAGAHVDIGADEAQ